MVFTLASAMCQAVDTGWLTCKVEEQHLINLKINSLKHLKQYFGAPIICIWGHNNGHDNLCFYEECGATVESDFTEEITTQGLMKAQRKEGKKEGILTVC